MDRSICLSSPRRVKKRRSSYLAVLWRTYGACENFGILPGGGHKGAILDLHWSRDSKVIYSASADQTLASWDLDTGTRIRKHLGHTEVINCMDVSKRGEEMLVSASDDGYIGVSWIDGSSDRTPLLNSLLSDLGPTTKGSH
jgi:WD40 repeat protein